MIATVAPFNREVALVNDPAPVKVVVVMPLTVFVTTVCALMI